MEFRPDQLINFQTSTVIMTIGIIIITLRLLYPLFKKTVTSIVTENMSVVTNDVNMLNAKLTPLNDDIKDLILTMNELIGEIKILTIGSATADIRIKKLESDIKLIQTRLLELERK